MEVARSAVYALLDIPREVVQNWTRHWDGLLPWLVLWFGLHFLVEWVIPWIFPSIFDFLGRDGKLRTASERNRDARTKVVAMTQAIFVSALPALWGRFASGEYERLQVNLYTTSEFVRVLTEANAAYFMWDIVVCMIDKLSLEWHVHAWLAFLSFTLALHPFASYMGMVALIFEISTPFLHARKLLIQLGYGSGLVFQGVQLIFAVTFLWSRIIFGFPEAYQFQKRLLALITSGTAHSNAVALLYMVVIAGGHYALNVMWFYHIVQAALRPVRGGKQQAMRAKSL